MSGKKYVTVAALAERFKLPCLTPDVDLEKVNIFYRSVNRPQMFLTGYEGHFNSERVQLFGEIETYYLQTKTEEQRRERFRALVATGIPVIILCRGINIFPELIEEANAAKVPVLISQQNTSVVMVDTIEYLNEQLAPVITRHGVLVDVYGEGILITGVSGVGKSETAIELVKRGHRLVADDMVELSRITDTMIMGSAPALTRHFVELRGIGIVDVKALYGVECVKNSTPLDMIINLEDWDKNSTYDRLGLDEEYENILGMDIVKHTVPIRTGRNLSIIIETAAVNNRQKKMGYNAAQELVGRVTMMSRKQREMDSEG